ncbi:NAD(P)-dependent oxidoreductase [Tessaracoccus sp. MC1756]|uniref:NAD(P)-dependent oxidoreductase n=1 Tax=Tessaracoccus sp. MC1756 TaxID=2760311 RepID=UPI001602B980|nr:NAD(P)-dependent oxidoreductase [Tessaracoccus sp. MC1756]MBB1510933.1 NAD(P)-dependent oxidoreductase [Tessaracoccus sp. MC1756]
MPQSVGFVGLGTMGSAMAQRLVDAGIETHVWNRSPGKADALVQAGALEERSVADVFAASEVLLSMLSNDAACLAAFSDEELSGAAGKIHVNMATVSLEASRALVKRHAEHGVRYIAAPVLGRPEVAAAGKLNIVAAGADDDITAVAGVLEHLGKRTWRVGDQPEQASLVKIGVNYNLIHALQALGESVSLMERGGIDGQTFVDILTDVAFTGSAYVGYGALIAQKKYVPAAFSVDLGLKDLGLAEAAAHEVGAALPTAPVMRAMFEEAAADPELKDGDWSIIAEVIRRTPATKETTQ